METTKSLIRQCVKILGQKEQQFSYPMLYEALNMSMASDMEKHAVRSRVNEMIKSEEVVRISNGIFTYNSKFRLSSDSPLRKRIWKFIRTSKPGWTLKEAALLTGVSYDHVFKFCLWLEEIGYVEKIGKKGTSQTFKATTMANQSPEMPQPPGKESTPFEKEAKAAGQIVNLMLCHNPYQPKTALEISQACKILLARFDKTCNQIKNEEIL